MGQSLDDVAGQMFADVRVESVSVGEDDPPSAGARRRDVSDGQTLQGMLFIEQYASLRSEIERRLEIRQQLDAIVLVIAGTFLTIGVQSGIPAVVLLFYPLLAMFIAAAWAHNDMRIGQIIVYVQTVVESKLGNLGPGWETFRRATFSSARTRRWLRRRSLNSISTSGLNSSPVLIGIATRGLFLTTQFLALAIFAVRFTMDQLAHQNFDGLIRELNPPYNSSAQIGLIGFLFVVALNIGVMGCTAYFLRHRRIRLPSGAGDQRSAPSGDMPIPDEVSHQQHGRP